jgi:flagellar secretion chaperone FliS
MAVNNPYSQYQETQFNTQTPGRLLLMVYDAAIRFAMIAAEKMKEGKLDEQSVNIVRVQNIVIELMSTLDPRRDRQLAANLSSLYSYIFDKLTQANIRDDLAALNEVVSILTEMRATWAQAETLVRTGAGTNPIEERAAA